MKIKFNWGTGIVIAMIVMISGMLVLVSIALRQDYDLVDDDYYQKSINYQQHIEKVKNNEALQQKIKFEQTGDTLNLAFPRLASSGDYKGTIHFYSPVEENRDLTVELKPDTGFVQTILLNKLEAGRYQVKIDWNAGSTAYYHEQEITVER
ncbi:MAG: FixH family protein [Prolixibacteraceae bacterium]|nr:FixH family protein [Prolixibacteraceae bacterium]